MENYMLKGCRMLKNEGAVGLAKKVYKRICKNSITYNEWFYKNYPTAHEIEKQRKFKFEYNPLVSVIVPVYNTPLKFLREMVESLENQTYSKWELCIANGSKDNVDLINELKRFNEKDSRIKYVTLKENKGIAGNTNEALKLASGDYVALLDHDDVLNVEALFRMVEAMQPGGIDVLYSDEDFLSGDGKSHIFPILKPDYSEDLLCSHNYITHFFVAKRKIVEEIGGFRSIYDGAQDYDLIFRCVEHAKTVKHVPRILYHWRMHEASVAGDPDSKKYAYDAGKKAIEDHLKRVGISAEVGFISGLHGMYHPKYDIINNPKLSIIVLAAEEPANLELIQALKNDYSNMEIIIMGETRGLDSLLQDKSDTVKRISVSSKNSSATIRNLGAKHAKGEFLLFLDSGLKPESAGAIRELLGCCCRDKVGAVGAKILNPDNTVYHAGIVLGGRNGINYPFQHIDNNSDGYLQRPRINCNYSAVSGKALMVKRNIFLQLKGFDSGLCDDICETDFCRKVWKTGNRVVYNAHSQWKWKEEKQFILGLRKMDKRSKTYLTKLSKMKDPFYNVNFENAEDVFSVIYKK